MSENKEHRDFQMLPEDLRPENITVVRSGGHFSDRPTYVLIEDYRRLAGFAVRQVLLVEALKNQANSGDAMTEQLKPCPFCGGEARFDHVKTWTRWSAGCTDCGCRTRLKLTKDMALEAWNSRVNSETLSNLLDALLEYHLGGQPQAYAKVMNNLRMFAPHLFDKEGNDATI